MVPDLVAIAAAQNAVFTAAQAQSCGYSSSAIRRLVRAGAWLTVRRGIYTAALEADHRMLVAAALLALDREDLVAAQASAAILWGLDWLHAPDPETVHLAHPRPGTVRVYRGLHVSPVDLPSTHVCLGRTVPLTTVARTVVDLARTLPFRDAVVLADSALRRTDLDRTELAEVMEVCRTWCGGRRAAAVVEFADPLAESPAESLARVVVAEAGLPKPELQVRIHDSHGLIGRVDMLVGRVVIEIDGKVKYTDPDDLWREKRREDRLRAAGYEVVRLTWADLMGPPERIRQRVLVALQRAA